MSDLAKMLDPRYGHDAGLLAGMLDPNVVKRGDFWPVGRTADGGWTLALPQGAIDAANSLQSAMDMPVYYDEQGQMQQNPAVTETALNTAMLSAPAGTMAGPSGPGILGMNVWHGGPHKWAPEPDFPHGRPRLDKLGTGEGAQAYGHGFYSAEAEDVGREYMAALAQKVEIDGQPFLVNNRKLGTTGNKSADDVLLAHNGDIEAAIADVQEHISKLEPWQIKRGRVDEELAALESLRGRVSSSNSGTLYKLDIPDEDVAKYLDWDAPLSEQPKEIRDAFTRAMVGDVGQDPLLAELFSDGVPNEYMGLFDKSSGAQAYHTLAAKVGGEQQASEALRAAGIPGLKYYDGMSRAQTGGKVIDVFQDGGKWKAKVKVANRTGVGFNSPTDMITTSKAYDTKEAAEKWAKEATETGTRNFVTWDQDVLNRTKVLERNGMSLVDMLAAE